MSYIETNYFPKPGFRIPVRMMAKKGAVKSLFTTFEEETEMPSDDAIKVFLRLKPSKNDGENIIEVLDSKTILFKIPPNLIQFKKKLNIPDQYKYTFSSIFKPEVSQEDIFNGCVSNHVKDLFAGQHCLLFTYGTTNAGKTFTVLGTGEQPGIIPRTLTTVFKSIRGKQYGNARIRPHMFNSALEVTNDTLKEELEFKHRILNWNHEKSSESSRLCKTQSTCTQSSISEIIGDSVFKQMQSQLTNDTTTVDYEADPDDRFSVWVSFAEIYNESIFDLLQPAYNSSKRKQLKLAQDNRKNCYIKGLRHVFVQTEEEAYKVLMFGKNNLQVAATGMNSSSSRSHCIFSVKLMKCPNVESPERVVVSSFSICDLAGAERQKKTLNVGQRLKESQSINCSLHVLSRCFSIIRENQLNNESTLIPFRDSKLTQLFQHALLGRESVTMIVNVNSEHDLCEETQHVLKASAIAKHIVVQPRITHRPPRPTRTSRFSHFIRHNRSTLIRWDSCVKQKGNEAQLSSVEDETATTNNEGEQKGEQYENLLVLVESLKEKLKEEKEKHLQLRKNCRIREDNIREEMRKELSEKLEEAKTQSEFDCKRAQELTDGSRSNRGENIISKEGHTRPKRPRTEAETVEEEESLAIEDLQEEISMQQKHIDGLTELVNILKDEKKEVTMDLTCAKMQLSWKDKEIENLKKKIEMFADEDEIKAGYIALQKEMEEKIEGRDNLLEEARNDLLEELRIRDEHEHDIAKLEEDLAEKEEDVLKLEEKIRDLQKEIQDNAQGMDMLQYKIEEAETEFDEEKKNFKIEYNTLKEELLKSNEEVVKLRQQLTEEAKPNEQLQTEVAVLKSDIDKLLSENIDLKEQLHQKTEELNSNQKMASDQLSIKKEEYAKAVHDLEVQIAQKLAINEQHNKEILEKNDEVASLEQSLKSQIKETTRVMEILNVKIKEVDCLSKDVAKAKTLIDELEKLLGQKDHELACARSKITGYESSIPALQAEFDRQQKEMSVCKRRCEDQLETIINMEQEASSFQTNQREIIGKYEDQLKKSKEEIESLKKEVAKVANVFYKSTPTPKKYLEKQIEELKKQLEDSQTTCKKLKEENETSKNQVRFYLDEPNDENENIFETSKPEHCTQPTSNLMEPSTRFRTRSKASPASTTKVTSTSKRSQSATKARRTRTQKESTIVVSDLINETNPEKMPKQIRKKLYNASNHDETSLSFDNIEIENIPQDSPGTIVRNLRSRNKEGKTEQNKKKSSTHADSCVGCHPQHLRTSSNTYTESKHSRRKLFSQDRKALLEIDMKQYDFVPEFAVESPCTHIKKLMKENKK